MEELAKDLVKQYPTLGDPRREGNGWDIWFFHSVHGLGASGLLEDRLKNQRKLRVAKQRAINPPEDSTFLNWVSEDEDGRLCSQTYPILLLIYIVLFIELDNPEPDEKIFEFLRQNFGGVVKGKMLETVFQRRTFIRQQKGVDGLNNIIQHSPRLFDTEEMV